MVAVAVTGWLSLERRDQDCMHLFRCFSRVNTNVRVSDCQSYSACPALRCPACQSVLSAVSSQHLLVPLRSLSTQCAVTTHRNTAQRIASHRLESHLVTAQWFSLVPLLSFVAYVPGPVPVLIILLCPISTLSCLRHRDYQYHCHNHHHNINRSLVPPPRPRSAIHGPHTASSGSHVTEIAHPSSRPPDCPCPHLVVSHRLVYHRIASHRLVSPLLSLPRLAGSCCVLLSYFCRLVSSRACQPCTCNPRLPVPVLVSVKAASN